MLRSALVLLVASVCCLHAQTISDIAASDVDQHHCRIVANLSVDSYVHIAFGTVSGGPYPWNTYRYLTGAHTIDLGVMALDISALRPGTTYYGVILAGSTTTTDSVSSSEFTCTTSAAGSPYPTSPTTYLPPYPTTTSGYTTVPLTLSSNLFVAASTVSHTVNSLCTGDPGWTVTAGDSLATIFGEVNFGAIIEFPQGVTGQTPAGSAGYFLPQLAVDPCANGISDPNHRWVIVRTHQNATADFPPYGFRTSPAWATNMATLQAEKPQTKNTVGQHFSFQLSSGSATPVHHFWISNLHLTVDPSQGTAWGTYVALGNTEGNPNDATTPPAYDVIERNFLDGAAPPTFSESAIAGGVGNNVLIRGNYALPFQENDGAIAQGIYIFDCSIGPLTVENNEVNAAGEEFYVETNDSQACGSRPFTAPIRNVSLTHSTLYEPPSWLNPRTPGYGNWDGISRGLFRNPIEHKYCQYCLLKGNWVDGSFSGQNAGIAILWTGRIDPNQHPDATGQHDLEVTGNFIRHASVFMTAEGSESLADCCGTGPDVSSTERLYTHDNVALDLGRYLYTQCSGSLCPPDVNLGGLDSNYFQNYGVQGQLTINNTLGFIDPEWQSGYYYSPQIFSVYAGGPSNGGFQFTNNIAYLSQGVSNPTSTGILPKIFVCPGGCATFPVCPGACGSFPVNTTSPATILATNAVSLTSTSTASGVWRQNTVICGLYASGAFPWPDLNTSGCSYYAAFMPSGDTYPNANTRALREVQAGLLNISNDDPTLTPTAFNYGGAVGARLQLVESELGVVNNISVLAGSTSVTIDYTAPDSNSCSADVSGNGGTNWTRRTDSGGNRIRSLTFTSLPSSTAIQYRLMCYFAQANASGPDRPWFGSGVPWDHSNQQTEGTISTASGASRTVLPGFVLPSGASKAVYAFASISGSTVSQTCTSPCSVTLTTGTWRQTLTYETSGSVAVGVPSVSTIFVE